MPSKNYILFVDLETTGSRTEDDILEVGCVLTNRNLDVIAYRNWLITPGTMLPIREIDPVVIEMHAKSGLWADLARVVNNYQIIEDDILGWLDEHTKSEKEHIPFAGSGVGHFDRQYIRKHLPRFDKRLTYWPLDVGVFRRILKLAGVNADFLHTYTDQKPHRALIDAMLAVAEMRSYVVVERRQSGINPPVPWEHPLPLIDE